MESLKLFWQKTKEKAVNFFRRQSMKKHPWLLGVSAVLLFILLYILSALSTLRIFLPHYPELTGFPVASKNYLIVFQNNHELRPGGGFISAYGIAKFYNGIFTGIDVSDVYGDIDNHPYMDPPYPMKELLANQWYTGYNFRDANYEADFPKTAEELIRMFNIAKPQTRIDGVVAVNYSFLEDLLGAVGQIDVDGNLFSKDSLFEMLEHKVNNVDRHNEEQLANRKNILKVFAQNLIKKIVFSPLKIRRVSDAIVHSLATKEIQLYFTNPTLEKLSVDQGWSGQWPQTFNGDFLGVVEANLGGMKSDRYIKRFVTDHVTMSENPETGGMDLVSDVTVDIEHYGIDNIPLSGAYTGFYRIYIPRGATLLDVAPDYKKDLWQKDDGLFHIFGNIVRLNPGQKTELHYRYSLPASVLGKNNDYQLYIPKQSGTSQDYYMVIFEAPQGMRTLSTTMTPKENIGVFQDEISSDLHLDLNILPDKSPPQVIYQGMDALGKIVITFNENVSNESAEDPLNYAITDLNIKHLEATDKLTIDSIQHSGKGVTLNVKGMTNQPEERYGVSFKNISDTHGNIINPNSMDITVVQRFGK